MYTYSKIILVRGKQQTTQEDIKMKMYASENQKGIYGKASIGMNYLVCATGENIAETATLAEAIRTAEKNIATASEVRIHEYVSGQTWYLE